MIEIYIYIWFLARLRLQGEFLSRIVVVRERMMSKEKEVHGKWMTEERLRGSEVYSA